MILGRREYRFLFITKSKKTVTILARFGDIYIFFFFEVYTSFPLKGEPVAMGRILPAPLKVWVYVYRTNTLHKRPAFRTYENPPLTPERNDKEITELGGAVGTGDTWH